jgi:hypothetical protein
VLEYAGGGSFAPRQSQLHLVHRGTLETNSTSVFSDCREYRPGPMLSVKSDAAPKPKSMLTLPPGTGLTLQLTAAIDSDVVAAAGDPVTATVPVILNGIPNPRHWVLWCTDGSAAWSIG